MIDPEATRLALENMEGKNMMHPQGDLALGDGGFNKPWSWHLIPETVRMVEISMELCDGRPSMVEANLTYWVSTVKSYCPWGAKIISASANNPNVLAPFQLVSWQVVKAQIRATCLPLPIEC